MFSQIKTSLNPLKNGWSHKVAVKHAEIAFFIA